MKLKRCYICGRRCWWRPATFRVWGEIKTIDASCLKAYVSSGKLRVG